jgi:hypothetical protein
MDPISMETATALTKPDPGLSARPPRRLNEGRAAASARGGYQSTAAGHATPAVSGERGSQRAEEARGEGTNAALLKGTPQFPRRLGAAGAPLRRGR